MTLFEANLTALGRTYPALAARISSVAGGPDQGVWSVSRSGVPTVRRGGILLASAFDPVTEASRAVPDWGAEVDFAVLPGLGAGYLAEAAVGRHPDLPVVVAEADPSWFAEVLAHRDLTALWSNPRVVPIVGPDPGALGTFLGPFFCFVVETLPWRPLADRDPGWHRAVADQIAGARARARVNLDTYRRFRTLWRRNLSKNEAGSRDVRPLSALAGRWEGCPAVVAAAGPSLAEAFGWLEAHRERFVLVAVDTAWPSLAARGLEPDVLLVLDGQYWNARHVDLPPPDRTLVVTEWTGPPRAFRLAPGRTFVAATSLPFLRRREEALWGTLGTLASGGSVATAAWSLCLHFGCSEVAFAGLDLGFPRGQTHVPGSQFEEALHRGSGRLSPAETRGLDLRGWSGLGWRPALDGGQVLSDVRMDLFRDWLASAFVQHPGTPAVNLGTRGSFVPGMRVPSQDYGDQWKSIVPKDGPFGPVLRPREADLGSFPWDSMARLPGATDFAETLETVWAEARSAWGAEVWDRWSGRAKATWDRFPSARSRRAVEAVVREALTWQDFSQRA